MPGGGYIRYTYALNGRQLVADREFRLPPLEAVGEELDLILEILIPALEKEAGKIILKK